MYGRVTEVVQSGASQKMREMQNAEKSSAGRDWLGCGLVSWAWSAPNLHLRIDALPGDGLRREVMEVKIVFVLERR